MLKLPNLDDRYFNEMVKQSRSMISKLYPEWTDENAHDPGITLIELFSWYAELQQYYANRVTKKLDLKFLNLLGIEPQNVKSSEVYVTFKNVSEQVAIPKGTSILGGGIPFELEHASHLLANSIERIIIHAESELTDATAANKHAGVSYYAFGQKAQKGNQLLIGFHEPLPTGAPIQLYFKLFDQYPILANPVTQESIISPAVDLELSCYVQSDEVAGWKSSTLINDETHQFMFNGSITFQIDAPMVQTTIQGANDMKRYWLRFEIKKGRFEVAPKIDQVLLNTIKAIQQKTYSRFMTYDSSGEAFQTIFFDDYLAYYGRIEVQISEMINADETVWVQWSPVQYTQDYGPEDLVYRVIYDDQEKQVMIEFGDGIHGKIPPIQRRSIRVVLYDSSFESKRELNAVTALPNQQLELKWDYIQPEKLLLQTAVQKADGSIAWVDWHYVPDFFSSTMNDHHITFDLEESILQFGDDIYGKIPIALRDENIRIIQLICGGGSYGNITKGVIDQVDAEDEQLASLAVTNFDYAKDGADRETIDQAKERFFIQFNETQHAITSSDMERIVLQTPGLRIARVKAIPLFRPGLKNYPQQKAIAQVTIVVVPYSEEAKPYVSSGFLATVRTNVEKYRMLTTELHVIPPEYIKITVHAKVVAQPYFKDQKSIVVDALNQLLQPVDRSNRSAGWMFGKTVNKSDIFDVINRISGVIYIQDLWIEAEGVGYVKEQTGDIRIPPQGLVYSGLHSIQLISSTDI